MGLFSNDPEFISDGAIYAKTRDLIAEAKEKLSIVSPYMLPTDDFVREVVNAHGRKVDVRVYVRRDQVEKYREAKWFARFVDTGITIRSIDRLHSKLYVSEEKAIITSMNFSSSS